MSEENQAVENEGLIDEGIKEVQATEAEAQQEHPEVIDNVFAKDPEEVNTAIASEDEDTEFVKPEYFPEKFWNDEDGITDVEGLVKSYREMEKTFHKANIKHLKNMISHLQNNQGFHKTTLLWSVFKVGRKNME